MLRKLYDAVIAQTELISRGTLRVDETTELNDDTDVDGDLGVTGDQTVSGDQTVQGTATVEGSPEQDQDVTRKTDLDSVESDLSDDIDAVDSDLSSLETDFEDHSDRHTEGGADAIEIVDLDASGGEDRQIAMVQEDGTLAYEEGAGRSEEEINDMASVRSLVGMGGF